MAKVFQYKYSATVRQKVARFKRVLPKNPAPSRWRAHRADRN